MQLHTEDAVMASVYVYAIRNNCCPKLIHESNLFPDGVSTIAIRSTPISNTDNNTVPCKTLSRMIGRVSSKVSGFNVFDITESPEYLALLISIFNKANTLRLNDFGGDAAYGCLMGGLLQHNGLRELNFEAHRRMSPYQVKLLFEAIGSSPCLEKLDLEGSCNQRVQALAESHLVDALERNRSLKYLRVATSSFVGSAVYQNLFKVANLDTKVQSLTLCERRSFNLRDTEFDLPYETIADTLCRDDCCLKTLRLHSILPSKRAHSASTNCERLNSSVSVCTITWTQLDCSRIMETVGLFRSIVRLNIAKNKISDLSPLGPLLIGSNTTLESLTLRGNAIGETDAVGFFRKLPEMKTLRHVSFGAVRFLDSSLLLGVAADAVWRNKSLECLDINSYGRPVEESRFFAIVCVPLSLNHGGRRALEVESSTRLPETLWPLVLERATNISYCDSCGRFAEGDLYQPEGNKSPPVTSTRVDVVFWLLKEKILEPCLSTSFS